MQKPRRKKRPPKRVLALPDLEQSKAAVLNSLTSKSGQWTYDRAITDFVDWYCSEPRLATRATIQMTAECRGAAAFDGAQHFPLLPAEPGTVALDEVLTVLSNNIGHLEGVLIGKMLHAFDLYQMSAAYVPMCLPL